MNKRFSSSGAAFGSVAQAAEITGLSRFAIRQGVAAGDIPAIRRGRCILVDIQTLLADLRAEAEETAARIRTDRG